MLNPTCHTEIAPFYLYENLRQPWLCPLLAFARWLELNPKDRTGFIFRQKFNWRCFSMDPLKGMVRS